MIKFSDLMMETNGWMAALWDKQKPDMVEVVSLVAWGICCDGEGNSFITGFIPVDSKVIACTDEPRFIRYVSPYEECNADTQGGISDE